MNQHHRTFFLASLLTVVLAAGACTPIVAPPAAEAGETPVANENAADDVSPSDSATAVVATRSLRVRAEPNEAAEVIAGIAEGEQYPVLAISSDGLWVQLAIDSAPAGIGWVSTNFVTIEGPITDTPVIEVASTVEVTTTETVTSTAPSTDTVTTGVVSTEVSTDTATSSVTGTATITAGVGSEVTASEPITAVVTPAPGFAVVLTDGTRLRVRTTPSADAEVAGYVYNNETYQVLEISADGLWVHIAGSTDGSNPDNPDGGWVAAEFVVIGE